MQPYDPNTAPLQQHRELARDTFSRIGWGFFAMMLLMQGGSAVLALAAQGIAKAGVGWMITAMQQDWFNFVLTDFAAYGLGLPMLMIFLSKIPDSPVAPIKRVTPKQFGGLVLVSLALLYLTNFIGIGLNHVMGMLRGKEAGNLLDNALTGMRPLTVLIFGVLIGPVLEEFIFRGILLRKLRRYGEGVCIFASAFLFASFHGNIGQLFYAFALGALFAYVTLRSGRIRTAVLLHMLINFVGMFLSMVITESGSELIINLYGLLLVVMIIAGTAIFMHRIKMVRLRCGTSPLSQKELCRLFLLNPGTLTYTGLALILILYIAFFV